MREGVRSLPSARITELLIAWSEGRREALDDLMPLVYEELRRLASSYVRRERPTWVFKFNPAQRLRALFGWSSTYKGEL